MKRSFLGAPERRPKEHGCNKFILISSFNNIQVLLSNQANVIVIDLLNINQRANNTDNHILLLNLTVLYLCINDVIVKVLGLNLQTEYST